LGWESLLRNQYAELKSLLTDIRERYPKGSGPGDALLAQVTAAVRVTQEQGITGRGGSAKLDALGSAVKDANWGSLTNLERDLERLTAEIQGDAQTAVLVAATAPLRSPALRDVRDYLVESESFLDSALEAAHLQAQNAVSDASHQLAELLEEWRREVGVEDTTPEVEK
jgi:hypothetical protein